MLHSFLLIGQSNMAGRGIINEAVNIDTSRIKILRNGLWVGMFRPINPDRSFSGVSLAESFAESYAKKHDTDVGLICCADGGTCLEQWMPGTVLFENAVNNAKLAQRSSKIMGVLWHQGEGDMRDERYLTYQSRFEIMMSALKKELGIENVPVLVGGLGDFLPQCEMGIPENHKNYVFINQALVNIANDDELTAFVSAKGLTSNPDNLHFNSKSLYEFGLRYFEEYEKINKKVSEEIIDNRTVDITRTELELL